MRVLSVASEVYPLVKTGGLADVAGALPPALGPPRRRGAHAAAGLSGGAEQARRRRASSATSRRSSAGRRGSSPAEVAGLELFVLDARTLYDRPGSPYGDPTAPTGPTTGAASARSAAPRPTSASASCPSGGPTSCMPTTGRPASSRPTCASAACRAAVGADHPQSRLPGPVPRRRLRRARPAAAGVPASTASNTTAASAS